MRGLFEIALHRGWPTMAYRLLGLCKMLDKRLWGFQNPLRQFTILKQETLVKLEGKNATVDRLRDMTADEIGKVCCVASLYRETIPEAKAKLCFPWFGPFLTTDQFNLYCWIILKQDDVFAIHYRIYPPLHFDALSSSPPSSLPSSPVRHICVCRPSVVSVAFLWIFALILKVKTKFLIAFT